MKGKNIIITGSNRGLGKALIKKFADSGCNIWACARKYNLEFETFLNETAIKNNVWIKPVYFDLVDEKSLLYGIQSIINDKQSIDVLINNAGVSSVGLLNQVKIESIKQMFDVNFFSILHIIQMISKKMIRQRRGCIINISSLAGIEPQAGKIPYASSKAAVIMMTKCLAKELGPLGIRVNSIAPGPIETEMLHQYSDEMLHQLATESSLRRIGTVDEIANVALFLVSNNASYINGEIIKVDGGR